MTNLEKKRVSVSNRIAAARTRAFVLNAGWVVPLSLRRFHVTPNSEIQWSPLSIFFFQCRAAFTVAVDEDLPEVPHVPDAPPERFVMVFISIWQTTGSLATFLWRWTSERKCVLVVKFVSPCASTEKVIHNKQTLELGKYVRVSIAISARRLQKKNLLWGVIANVTRTSDTRICSGSDQSWSDRWMVTDWLFNSHPVLRPALSYVIAASRRPRRSISTDWTNFALFLNRKVVSWTSPRFTVNCLMVNVYHLGNHRVPTWKANPWLEKVAIGGNPEAT